MRNVRIIYEMIFVIKNLDCLYGKPDNLIQSAKLSKKSSEAFKQISFHGPENLIGMILSFQMYISY